MPSFQTVTCAATFSFLYPSSGVQHTWCLTSTEAVPLIRDGEKGGGEGGMEVGGRGRLYTYTVTTRMIPALRWAVMRAILMFQ